MRTKFTWPRLLAIASFAFSIVFFIYSCRKINDKESAQLIVPDKLEQQFFKVPENISPQLQDVINDIQKQNNQYHFLPEFLRKNGLPVWNKVVANVEGLNPKKKSKSVQGFSGRLSSQDSAEVYFIPFKMTDNSINTFLSCVKINNQYSFKVYRRNYLTNLNITIDSVNHYRKAALGIFRYFEGTINNKDTIQVGGVVQQIFSDADIIFNDSSSGNKTGALIGSRQLSSITVVYCVGGAQMRISGKAMAEISGCWGETLSVYGSDLGISIISGGYSDGSPGGGSGGSSGTGVVFNCPSGLWWCESGEYSFVEGTLITSLDYPGKQNGFPWLWWENNTWLDNNISFSSKCPLGWCNLTQAERDFIKTYPISAFSIWLNAGVAKTETRQMFNIPQSDPMPPNDKSNAFLHAFWCAMNSFSVGEDKARLFAAAHESGTPAQLQLETTMDFFNNEVGFAIANTQNSLFSYHIFQALQNGELRYLKPIDSSDPFFWGGPNGQVETHGIIPGITNIVPTNQ